MDFTAYKQRFRECCAALVLPPDCQEAIPPTPRRTTDYSWTFKWVLTFADQSYVEVREHYGKIKGVSTSRRLQFSFHYGPILARTPEGLPAKRKGAVHIRIDNIAKPPHLHLGTDEPRYPQDRVDGLKLDSVDMFTFLRMIFEHRTNGLPIDNCFGFRIK